MATTYGLTPGSLKWGDEFSASIDNKGRWEASNSFTCYINDVTTLTPKKGAPCQETGFTFLGFDSASVSQDGADKVKVTCKYVGAESEEQEFSFEDNTTKRRTELGISVGEEPIETHPRYKDISDKDKVNIQHCKAGRFKPKKDAGKYTLKADDPNAKEISFVDPLSIELVEKILGGVTNYLVANQVWRVSYFSRNKVSSTILNKVGKIANASGAPTVNEDRNWLFVGASSSEEGNGYTINLEWRLSGPGGWDEDLYED